MNSPSSTTRSPSTTAKTLVFSTLLLLTVLAVVAWSTQRLEAASKTIRDRVLPKILDSEHIVYYEVDQESGPSFRLDDMRTEYKLISHLSLDPDIDYEAKRFFTYALNVRIDDPNGEKLWERTLHLRTRQSKDELVNGVWRYENAFDPNGKRELCDDRLSRFYLPHSFPVGSVLSFRVEHTDPTIKNERVLLRLYQARARSDLEKSIQGLSLRPEEQQVLAGKESALPWWVRDRVRQDSLLRFEWMRKSALGLAGRDFKPYGIYYSGFRLPLDELKADKPERVDRYRAWALNIMGPSVFEFGARLPDDEKSQDGEGQRAHGETSSRSMPLDMQPVHLSFRAIHAEADSRNNRFERAMRLDGEQPESYQRLELGPGLHTLIVESSGPVLIWSRGPTPAPKLEGGSTPWPDIRWSEKISERDDTGREWIRPERRRLRSYRVGEKWSEVEFPFEPSLDSAASILKVEMRSIADQPTNLSWPVVSYRFLDAREQVLAEGKWEIEEEPIFTPFEALDGFHESNEGKEIDSADEDVEEKAGAFELPEAPVLSEPSSVRFVAPVGSAKVQLFVEERDPEDDFQGQGPDPELAKMRQADAFEGPMDRAQNGDALLRAFIYLAPEDYNERIEWGQPYRDSLREIADWRYAPIENRRWFPLRAENHPLAVREGSFQDVLVQVRLHPRGIGWDGQALGNNLTENRDRQSDSGPWKRLPIYGLHESQRILEEIEGEEKLGPQAGESKALLVKELRRGRPFSLSSFAFDGTRALSLAYFYPKESSGDFSEELNSKAVFGLRRGEALEEEAFRALASRGQWKWAPTSPEEGLASAKAELFWKEGPKGLRVFVDSEEGKLSKADYYRRSLLRLHRERAWIDARPIFKEQREGEEASQASLLNLIVYVPESNFRKASRKTSGKIRLHIDLDRKDPRRRRGEPLLQLTKGQRDYEIALSGPNEGQVIELGKDNFGREKKARKTHEIVFLDRAEALPMRVIRIPIPLGRDLLPNLHRIRIHKRSGPPLWIRAFQRGQSKKEGPSVQWTEIKGAAAG